LNKLIETNPELLSEFHETLNEDISLDKLTKGSDQKIWWKCNVASDHIWQASVSSRVRGTGCPCCSGKKFVFSKSLAFCNEHLSKQWHPFKNGNLTPQNTRATSKEKIWWICQKNNSHVWPATVNSRSQGTGCPFCANLKIQFENSLSAVYPEIAKQWHPSKNGLIKASQIAPRAKNKYWWKCDVADDHEWEASVDNRQKGNCPICSNRITVESNALTTTHPDLCKEWHPTKNFNLIPNELNAGSNRKIWWKCNKANDHEWEAKINTRTRKNAASCPCCANLKIVESNCLKTTHPQLIEEWNWEKNKQSPNSVVWGTRKKVWWKCKINSEHVWEAAIANRATKRNQGCPFCKVTNTSKNELEIMFELMLIFKEINPENHIVKVNNKSYRVDIFIPSLKLIIEYDGSFWHKNKFKKDLEKTSELISAGFQVLRLRQNPLNKITDNDIITEKEFNCKRTTNKILNFIKDSFNLTKETTDDINNYINKSESQNSNQLNIYYKKLISGEFERFIIKSNQIFDFKYDYSRVSFKNVTDKVEIICKNHGSFSKSPSKHLNGQGCPKCARINGGKIQTMGLTKFIEKAREIHGNKYIYDNSIYEKTHIKIEIGCVKHGKFMQSPANHLRGQGCPECGRIVGDKNRIMGLNRFIEKAKEIHGDKYNYENAIYEKCYLKIEIGCVKHGYFMQSPSNHLRGQGCPKCGKIKSKNKF